MWDPSKDRKERRRRASERSEAFDRYKVDDSSWRAATAAEVEREVVRADYAHEDLGAAVTAESEVEDVMDALFDSRRCALCGEGWATENTGDGRAEMFDPARPDHDSEIVHYQCGEARGWELA